MRRHFSRNSGADVYKDMLANRSNNSLLDSETVSIFTYNLLEKVYFFVLKSCLHCKSNTACPAVKGY